MPLIILGMADLISLLHILSYITSFWSGVLVKNFYLGVENLV